MHAKTMTGLLCCLLSLAPFAGGQTLEEPVESFSRLPHFASPNLSPDGSQVAYLMAVPEAGAQVLAAQSLESGERTLLLKSDNTKIRINWFDWANNGQLLVSARFAGGYQRVESLETRMLVIKADDPDDSRLLFKPRPFKRDFVSQFQDKVIDLLPEDPEHILVALDADVPNLPSVFRVNLNTGAKKRVERGKLDIRSWQTDGQSRVRLGSALDYKTGEGALYHRAPEGGRWQPLFEYRLFDESEVTPLGFGADPMTLYYTAYQDGFKALYTMDLESGAKTLVHADPERDLDGGLLRSPKTGAVLGIHHAPHPKGRIYWNDHFAALEAALEQALPGQDFELLDFSEDEDAYLLFATRDAAPGAHYVGRRSDASLVLLSGAYPELGNEPRYEQRAITYAARDGVEIEAYLSLPKGAKAPRAAIVFPHGGPHARDHGGFDYWTALFTDRGYAVIQPNFRGSAGYGYDFSQARMQQWGLQMQDDLTDAAHWLVEEGIADPARLCIVGGSYGGYAAMMATVKTPSLFRCAVSFAGVSDLKKVVARGRDYLERNLIKEDLGSNAKDLKARSPYHHASQIETPLLLAHGEDDRVVDVVQSRSMAKALRKQGKPVEYLELPKGDHFLSMQANRHAFLQAMDSFLKRHLR